ncbi:MAG: 3-hydroxyacyl-ACP dehydratase FabZ [Pseudomonadota bacterium]
MAPTAPNPDLPQADIHQILDLIPHRPPFLFIDRLINIDGDESAVGIKNVTMNEPFFPGHFPGKPVMPGVIIIEAMAQTASAMVSHHLGKEFENSLVYFMAIDGAKFRRMVEPGDTLELHLSVLKRRGKVWRYKGVAMVGDEVAAEAEIMAILDKKAQDG